MHAKSKTGEPSDFKKKLQEQIKNDKSGKGEEAKNDKDDKKKKDDGKGGKDKKGGDKKGDDKNSDPKGKDGKGKDAKKGGKNKDSDDSDDDGKNKKKGGKKGDDDKKRGKSVSGKDDKNKQARNKSQPHIKQEELPVEPKKKVNPYIQVTEFYLGQYKAPICGVNIFEMHEWKGQHANLDINHAYFHWLFPHFQGEFGKERAQLFRENAVIGKRIIESYKLILDFYGIELESEATGQVSRMENGVARYKETFLKPYTNHDFRVKRMLQFLNVTGYRVYAIELVKFFDKEIFKIVKNVIPPLKAMELSFKMDWQPYGEVDPKDKRKCDQLAQKCLFPYQVLTEEINVHLKTLLR